MDPIPLILITVLCTLIILVIVVVLMRQRLRRTKPEAIKNVDQATEAPARRQVKVPKPKTAPVKTTSRVKVKSKQTKGKK